MHLIIIIICQIINNLKIYNLQNTKMPLQILMPELYPYVLIALTANYFMCNVAAALPGRVKMGIFTEEVRAKLSEGDHKELFGAEAVVAVGGVPDMGDGWYAKKLPYRDQISFAQAMRAHANYVE